MGGHWRGALGSERTGLSSQDLRHSLVPLGADWAYDSSCSCCSGKCLAGKDTAAWSLTVLWVGEQDLESRSFQLDIKHSPLPPSAGGAGGSCGLCCSGVSWRERMLLPSVMGRREGGGEQGDRA